MKTPKRSKNRYKPSNALYGRLSKSMTRQKGKRRLSKLRGSGDLKPIDTDINYKNSKLGVVDD